MTNSGQLEARALDALNGEVGKTVEVLDVLNEMYKAKVWLERGYRSFHCYCVERLRMSEDCAARRLHVAELLARYPKLLRPLLLERRVHVSGMSLLHSIITDENAKRLITEAAGKSRRQIEDIRARERPKDDVSTGMKRQPALNCEPQPAPVETPIVASPAPASVQESKTASVEPAKSFPLEVRSPGRSVYRTMLSDETRDGYERIKDLSGKNDEQIFEDMVKVYEAELLKRKHAQVEKPQQKIRPRHNQQDIPASVKREVWLRDNGQCQHCGTDGHICGSRKEIQYHHIITRADGGLATAENVSLRCKAHNLYQATLDFGAALVTNAIAAKRRKAKRRTGAARPSEVREPRGAYRLKATTSHAERGDRDSEAERSQHTLPSPFNWWLSPISDLVTNAIASKRRKAKRRTGAARPSEVREPRAAYRLKATTSPAERGDRDSEAERSRHTPRNPPNWWLSPISDLVTNAIASKRRKAKRRTGAAQPGEVLEPRAAYLFAPASKRRRGPMRPRNSAVHAATQGASSAAVAYPRVEPPDTAQRDGFEVPQSSCRVPHCLCGTRPSAER